MMKTLFLNPPSFDGFDGGAGSRYQVLDLLHAVTRERHVVGFDVVELLPSRNRAPDFLAAKLVYRLLSLIFEGGS